MPYPSPMRGQQGVVIPRRSQSQPVDLSHPPNSRLCEDGPLSPTYVDRSDSSDAWRGPIDVGRRRQLLASSRVTSAEEAEPPPSGPQAPIARLDSLQEMESALVSSRSSLSEGQPDSKSSQV